MNIVWNPPIILIIHAGIKLIKIKEYPKRADLFLIFFKMMNIFFKKLGCKIKTKDISCLKASQSKDNWVLRTFISNGDT